MSSQIALVDLFVSLRGLGPVLIEGMKVVPNPESDVRLRLLEEARKTALDAMIEATQPEANTELAAYFAERSRFEEVSQNFSLSFDEWRFLRAEKCRMQKKLS